MSHLLNKVADKLQGHAKEEEKQEKRGQGMGHGESHKESQGMGHGQHEESKHQRGIAPGTRRKQEYNSEELYTGTAQGYEGIPSEDSGAYAHSGNTGRDRDSSRAETRFGSGNTGRNELEQDDPDTFTSGQYTTGQFDSSGKGKQVHKEWSEHKGNMGSGNEEMMGSERKGRNW